MMKHILLVMLIFFSNISLARYIFKFDHQTSNFALRVNNKYDVDITACDLSNHKVNSAFIGIDKTGSASKNRSYHRLYVTFSDNTKKEYTFLGDFDDTKHTLKHTFRVKEVSHHDIRGIEHPSPQTDLFSDVKSRFQRIYKNHGYYYNHDFFTVNYSYTITGSPPYPHDSSKILLFVDKYKRNVGSGSMSEH